MPILRGQMQIDCDSKQWKNLRLNTQYEHLPPGSFRGAERGLGSISVRVFDAPYDFGAVTFIPSDKSEYRFITRDYGMPGPLAMRLDAGFDRFVTALGNYSTSLLIMPTDVLPGNMFRAEVFSWVEGDSPSLTIRSELEMAAFADRMLNRMSNAGTSQLITVPARQN